MSMRQMISEYFDGPGNYTMGYICRDGYTKTVSIHANNKNELADKWFDYITGWGYKANSLTFLERSL